MAWTLVYENDSAGAATFGNIQILIAAIRNGASIKVGLQDTSQPDYWVQIQPHSVRVKGNVVSAMMNHDVSAKYVGNSLQFLDDSYYYMMIANTTGVFDQMRWSVGEHTARGHDQNGSRSMRWFVD
jgi:hypothetical protein